VYRGQFDFASFSTQVHDFNPGITPYPSGLVWTLPMNARDAVDVQMGAGRARMRATDVAVEDYFNIPNAFFQFLNPVSAGATCTFDIRWDPPVTTRGTVQTPATNGQLLQSQATMTWSASNAQGFHFQSDPQPTTSVFAQLGRIRNGVFANR
jgi:hypothetical protein